MPYALCPMPYAHEYLIFLRKAIQNQIISSKLTDLILTVNQQGNRQSRLFRIANIASIPKSQIVRKPLFRNAQSFVINQFVAIIIPPVGTGNFDN